MTSLVIDASAVVEFLTGAPEAVERLGPAMVERRSVLAPELLDVEVAHAVRRLERIGDLGTETATTLIDSLVALPVRRFAHGPLIRRAFELRANVTPYDALYIALAEAADAALVTFDAGFAANAAPFAATELLSNA